MMMKRISILFIFCLSCKFRTPNYIVTAASDQFCEGPAEPLHGYVPLEELQKQPWDVIILGGGPAGTGAGCASRLLGKQRVLVVHQSSVKVGTIATNQGAPSGLFSKALRDVAKTLDVQVLKSLGLSQHVIWAQVREMTQRLAAGSHRGTYLMFDLGVHVVRGRGRLVSDTKVAIQLAEQEGPEIVVKAQGMGSSTKYVSTVRETTLCPKQRHTFRQCEPKLLLQH